MNLVLLDAAELTSAQGNVTLNDERARHLLDVLRVTPGQPIRIGVVNGPLGVATVTAYGDGRVTLACSLEARPPVPRVDLLLALPRPKVMRRLWAQLAAVGVRRIILTNAERVERNYFDTHVLSSECYRPLLVEGLQQARDTRVPDVSIHRQFRVLIEDELDTLAGDATKIVAHPGARPRISEAAAGAARVLLAIGPEGGWNEFELSLLEKNGFQRASAGLRTLRSDTACIALLALVHDGLAASG